MKSNRLQQTYLLVKGNKNKPANPCYKDQKGSTFQNNKPTEILQETFDRCVAIFFFQVDRGEYKFIHW